ncbi:MAG: peptidylprolyl isomerase [Tenuifilum sp.]|uniref:FKBP-type peptidyl-prolyl cis-trans isomerase n=1 Tax=Tenuifilum sp. TaxID=2760880 RepID=UPI001B5B52FA|nr:peptidylprolyl isomerase [Bacteroidales bacterium]HOK61779.1 peptidylprolyl isomerase [Tenuifilum sp.]MBP9030092.1 peptidylprolyl isomerase [Bacteroidales bacterium]HOK86455.1 peptidylprolyl isomerase [Tenuifilum sp.]HON71468.1 peptidylprolyl isomerase [Tenuifilum sp.]
MNVSKNKVVSISYELKVDGDLIDAAQADNPLVFLYGHGQLLPLFEDNIKDLAEGDSFEFMIPSKDGYGEVNDQAIVELPKEIFVIDGELQEDLLVIGNRLPMRDSEGNALDGTVVEVTDNSVVMDFNHPLAGKDLYFTGKVENIREATAEEISHGHVHGMGHDH